MTRETKLGLFVGMLIIIVIGIAISDKLSVSQPTATEMTVQHADEGNTVNPNDPSVTRDGVNADHRLPVPGVNRQAAHENERQYPRYAARQMYPAHGVDQSIATQYGPVNRESYPQQVYPPQQYVQPQQYYPPQAYPAPGRTPGLQGGHPVPVQPTRQVQPVAAPRQQQYMEYTIKEGDRLWTIAKRFYGSGTKHEQLLALNKDRISNPRNLPIGKTILVPKR